MGSFTQHLVDAAAQRVPDWLQAVQGPARERWAGIPLPTRRQEAWKYTSLAALRDDYQPATGIVACCWTPKRYPETPSGAHRPAAIGTVMRRRYRWRSCRPWI